MIDKKKDEIPMADTSTSTIGIRSWRSWLLRGGLDRITLNSGVQASQGALQVRLWRRLRDEPEPLILGLLVDHGCGALQAVHSLKVVDQRLAQHHSSSAARVAVPAAGLDSSAITRMPSSQSRTTVQSGNSLP
jgi:hypothetical protein